MPPLVLHRGFEGEEAERWGGRRLVTRAKKARSAFRGGQGRVPRKPMPKDGVVATMRLRGGRGGIGVEMGRVKSVMTFQAMLSLVHIISHS